MNIPIIHIAGQDANDPAKKRDYLFQVGLISSALEHAVPEQMFVNDQNPGEAISAVKALQKANAQGQRIYHLTPDNQGSILPNIHHTAYVMDEIRNALNAGKEVITHTDAVSVPGWTGAGYILFDPNTGDGAFKIGGGMNGGFFAGFQTGMAIFLLIGAVFTVPALTVIPAILFSILIFIGFFSSFLGAMINLGLANLDNGSELAGLDNPCYLAGMLAFLPLPSAYLSPELSIALNMLLWVTPSNFPNPRGCLGI